MRNTLLDAKQAEVPERTRTSPVATLLGSSVKITGKIFSIGDLYIAGIVDGTVEAREILTIGPGGMVHADLTASEVVVLGEVNGNIEATEKIEIRRDAKVTGDIRTSRLIVEDGAYFKGSIDIVRLVRSRLAVLGSVHADEADAQAEREISEQDYTTLDDPKSLEKALFGASIVGAVPAQARIGPEEVERSSAIWGRA